MKNNAKKDYNNIILDSIADGVFTVDLEKRITSMNKAAEKILGIDEEQVIGNYCSDIFHASICEHSCALQETLETNQNIVNKVVYIINSEGDKIPISISTSILRDEDGNAIGGVETFRDISDIEELRKTIESKYTFNDIVSKNQFMHKIFSILPDIAVSDSSVLIEGASGTGKELIARAIHNLSDREKNPLVVINCAAIPENLLESELFGYKAGAFTDAKKDKPGKIAMAEGGSLFLDEIGEVPKSLQVKLLRFLQEKEYEPLGSTKTIKADVRIIAATNKNLLEEVHNKNFRDDLYYRINVINIKLPSLNQRKEDIPLLVKHFIKKFNALKRKNIEGLSDEVMSILLEHDYKGNIRELENILEHCFVLCNELYIQKKHLPHHLQDEADFVPDNLKLEDIEKNYIIRALKKHSWNKTTTAEELGINITTLWRKINKYNIEK